jgi:hypothetical protein
LAFRTVTGLSYAALALRPKGLPISRPRGSKAAGLRYERALGKALALEGVRAIGGQWFEFCDANGPGHCQTDLIIVGKKRVAIIECKLGDVNTGRAQLSGLYLPVARLVWPDKKALGIVAARHLGREENEDLVVGSLEEALKRAEEVIPTLHWIERTPVRRI